MAVRLRGRLRFAAMSMAVAAGVWGGTALAHPGHPQNVPAAPSDPSAARPNVEISARDGFRHITADGIPAHPTGAFPNRNNPNAIAPQRYAFRVPLEPKRNQRPTPVRGNMLFGVAVNGVPFDPSTAEFWNDDRRAGWNYEALTGPLNLGLDDNHAHVQPTGAYHYHGIPVGLAAQLAKAAARPAPESPPRPGSRMLLIGYAADGFPIYGPDAPAEADDAAGPLRTMKPSYRLKPDTRPAQPDGPGGKHDGSFTADYEYVPGAGDLDECNGRIGATPEYPQGTYYYVLTEQFPFVPRQWRGTPDDSFRKAEPARRGGPGAGGPAAGRPGRRPPQPPPQR